VLDVGRGADATEGDLLDLGQPCLVGLAVDEAVVVAALVGGAEQFLAVGAGVGERAGGTALGDAVACDAVL